MHDNCSMRIDLYTKAVLTIIAIMVTVIASNQIVNPRVASAQGSFAGVLWNGQSFFDSRTGEIREYNGVQLAGKYRVTKLGQPLVKEK